MCTVSWHFNNVGYQLFFNRDELITRQQALPPEIKQHRGVKFLAPTDIDGGGTWISSNEYGLTLCLLNNYADHDHKTEKSYTSRGQLVHKMSRSSSMEDLTDHLSRISLTAYRPFDMLALSLKKHCRQFCWDGAHFKIITNPEGPLTSSSFQTNAVIQSRVEHFKQAPNMSCLTTQQLKQYHASHYPKPGAFSVCMHRDDGSTVSFSDINVTVTQTHFNYFNSSPCRASEAHITRLGIKEEHHLIPTQSVTAES